MNLRQRLVAVAIVGLSLAGTTAVAASPADAAVPQGSCGSGYHLKGTKTIKSGRTVIGYLRWYMKVYRTDSPSRLCAITSPAKNYVGKTRKIGVMVSSQDGSDVEYANFKYYAGPVRVLITGGSSAYGFIVLKSDSRNGVHRAIVNI
ncbi:MAG: hypothetical protein JWN52_2650 [Actinomycetia bacterium]|nr:hypothetical protein [Actinomycetes bacterium]